MNDTAFPADLRDTLHRGLVALGLDADALAPRLLAYAASKGAVIAMTRSLAREMGEDGTTVNAIAPGLTLVEATAYVPQARHEHYLKGRAIQRPQVPEDVNAAALFLLTQASGFITGQLLPVNGGFVMH